MSDQKERRRFKRVNKYLEVQYYFGNNTEPIQVFTEDISEGGIRVHNPFPIDERFQFPIHIFLDQTKSETVKAIARVAWQRKKEDAPVWEMGLEFVQMPEADRRLVEQFVNE